MGRKEGRKEGRQEGKKERRGGGGGGGGGGDTHRLELIVGLAFLQRYLELFFLESKDGEKRNGGKGRKPKGGH
jgi:hypothetical protein